MPMTIGELYPPAMKITEQTGADAYLAVLIQLCLEEQEKRGEVPDRDKCEIIQRQNLAYYAGYYDNETRERVERLFQCAHPVFGSIAKNGPVTPERAFQLGQELGRKLREEEQ